MSTSQSNKKQNIPMSPDVDRTRYNMIAPEEHVLARPGMYIGSVDQTSKSMYVFDEESGRMKEKKLIYSPALLKIYDEIIINASDNKQRDKRKTMTYINVDIDSESGSVKIENDGPGIPVEKHPVHHMYNQTMIFGHMFSGSNLDDEEERQTAGMNGVGAKATNIFSKDFRVLSICSGMRFYQKFWNNMKEHSEPEISKVKPGTPNLTSIQFKPDFHRFHTEGLDEDMILLMKKRAYDIAACNPGLAVNLNGKKIIFKNFEQYVQLYITPPEGSEDQNLLNIANEGIEEENEEEKKSKKKGREKQKINKSTLKDKIDTSTWLNHVSIRTANMELVLTLSDDGFHQVSFVNSIWTSSGGTHIETVLNQITKAVIEEATKRTGKSAKAKNKSGLQFKPNVVQQNLFVFLNTKIVNPYFNSQTKEQLTTPKEKLQDVLSISDSDMKKVLKLGLVELLIETATQQASSLLSRVTDGRKQSRIHGIQKLSDANDAGTRKAQECTLILTEGDSAKALAVSGLGVIGRNKFGVFPLRGKVLNVRDASATQLSNNAEFGYIKKILGLQQNKKYEDTKELRYGHLMIMTDQDTDGSHIKGLIVNMFDKYWPSLLQMNGFLQTFITPIVKVTKGQGSRAVTRSFYTEPEFQQFRADQGSNMKKWKVKYYKGLGTSTHKEGKEYFKNINYNRKEFNWEGEEKLIKDSIDLAFSKKRADDRKEWLNTYKEGTYIDIKQPSFTYTDFIHKELILFSRADCMRSIASVVDGLKPGQRKILYACFKRNLVRNEIKVSQLSGYVSEVSAYHHGEQSLQSTIVNLARDFVGSNNINLLLPVGQFGTRLEGGKDAASARYIYTKLSPLARLCFKEDDDRLLKYLDDDGFLIEPEFYVPIIPMCLVNGSDGIGTGWSTHVPCFNPQDLIDNMRRYIRKEPMLPIDPWYRGFTGSILKSPNENKYYSFGRYYKTPEGTIEITELPVGKWTEDYRQWLEEVAFPDKDKEKERKDKEKKKAEAAKAKAAGRGRGRGRKEKGDEEGNGNDNDDQNPPEEGADANGDKQKDKPNERWLKDFRQYHTESTVHFSLTLLEGHENDFDGPDGYKKLNLITSINLTNMTMFDRYGHIKQYQNALDVLQEFCVLRLEYYQKRKANLQDILSEQLKRLENKERFIKNIAEGHLVIRGVPRGEVDRKLKEMKFDMMTKQDVISKIGANNPKLQTTAVMTVERDDEENESSASSSSEEDTSEDESEEIVGKKNNKNKANGDNFELDSDGIRRMSGPGGISYDYLLSMSISSITKEKLKQLQNEREAKLNELNRLLNITINELWLDDLDKLEEGWKKDEQRRIADLNYLKKKAKKGEKGKKGGYGRYDDDDDDDDDDFDEDDFGPKKGRGRGKGKSSEKNNSSFAPEVQSDWILYDPNSTISYLTSSTTSGAGRGKKKQMTLSDIVSSESAAGNQTTSSSSYSYTNNNTPSLTPSASPGPTPGPSPFEFNGGNNNNNNNNGKYDDPDESTDGLKLTKSKRSTLKASPKSKAKSKRFKRNVDDYSESYDDVDSSSSKDEELLSLSDHPSDAYDSDEDSDMNYDESASEYRAIKPVKKRVQLKKKDDDDDDNDKAESSENEDTDMDKEEKYGSSSSSTTTSSSSKDSEKPKAKAKSNSRSQKKMSLAKDESDSEDDSDGLGSEYEAPKKRKTPNSKSNSQSSSSESKQVQSNITSFFKSTSGNDSSSLSTPLETKTKGRKPQSTPRRSSPKGTPSDSFMDRVKKLALQVSKESKSPSSTKKGTPSTSKSALDSPVRQETPSGSSQTKSTSFTKKRTQKKVVYTDDESEDDDKSDSYSDKGNDSDDDYKF